MEAACSLARERGYNPLYHPMVFNPDFDLGRAKYLLAELTVALGAEHVVRANRLARRLARNLGNGYSLYGWGPYGPAFAMLCARARALADLLKWLATGRRDAARPYLAAGGLTAVAVWLLPARTRPRYQEEFRAELGDLASDVSARFQIAYSARLLSRAWSLRRGVRITAAPQSNRRSAR